MAIEPDEIEVIKIIARITQQGETTAFRELVDGFKARAFSYAIRILKNREDAEEVVQDAFIKVFYSLEHFKGESKFSTWFYRIVYNTSITKLSRKKIPVVALTDASEMEVLQYNETGVEWEQLQRKDREKYLHLAISALSKEDAIVLSLYYDSENSLEEIAQITGCNKAAAKVRLHRARGRLQQQLLLLLPEETKDLLG